MSHISTLPALSGDDECGTQTAQSHLIPRRHVSMWHQGWKCSLMNSQRILVRWIWLGNLILLLPTSKEHTKLPRRLCLKWKWGRLSSCPSPCYLHLERACTHTHNAQVRIHALEGACTHKHTHTHTHTHTHVQVRMSAFACSVPARLEGMYIGSRARFGRGALGFARGGGTFPSWWAQWARTGGAVAPILLPPVALGALQPWHCQQGDRAGQREATSAGTRGTPG